LVAVVICAGGARTCLLRSTSSTEKENIIAEACMAANGGVKFATEPQKQMIGPVVGNIAVLLSHIGIKRTSRS
jgi:hypothetical protein